jgi:hypothetical protein
MTRLFAVAAVLSVSTFNLASAQTTWVVDDNGTGDFVHIQSAVDAAASGDVIFVLDGAYAGFTIDAKSLVVAGEPGGDVRVAEFVVVRNVREVQKVELDSLRIGVTTFLGTGAPTVQLEDNQGSVRLVDCEVRGTGQPCMASYCNAEAALACQSSDYVGLVRSTFEGGDDQYYTFYEGPADGVTAWMSNLVVLDSTIVGGPGHDDFLCSVGLPGGFGLSAGGGTVTCARSTLAGGRGGLTDCFCHPGPCWIIPPGEAVELHSGATGEWKDSTFNDEPGPETGPLAQTAFASFCVGTWEECPCGNNGAAGAGCETSYDSGGVVLSAEGTPSVSADTVTLTATGFRMSATPSGLFFQGTTQVGGGAGTPFNDGLLCAGGVIRRLKGKQAVDGTMSFGFGVGSDQPVSVRGSVSASGGTHTYQVWYRNQAPQFCTAGRYNMSNGLEITWLP